MKNILKFALTRRIASVMTGVAMVGILVGGNVGTAFAADPTPATSSPGLHVIDGGQSIGIGSGGITLKKDGTTVDVSRTGTGITMDGKDHIVDVAIPIVVSDLSGTGNGWHITLTAPKFTTTNQDKNYTLQNPITVTSVGAATVPNSGVGTETAPSNLITSGLNNLDVSSSKPIYEADVADSTNHAGMGIFEIQATANVKVLANDYTPDSTDFYDSTFTLGFANGPTG